MVLLSLRITIILIISLTSQSLQPRLLSTKQSIRIINPIKPQYTTNKRNTCGLCASKNPTDTSSSTEIDPYANFPPQLTPFAKFLDKNTGGWALSYADCTPDDETTPLGVLFLLTNVAYLVVGGFLWSKGEVTLGVLTEVAGIVSYIYHYNQLAARGNNSPAVRLSLLIDYFTAGSALVFGTGLLFEEVGNEVREGWSKATAYCIDRMRYIKFVASLLMSFAPHHTE